MIVIRRTLLSILSLLLGGFAVPARADMPVRGVAVLENSPTLSYRDGVGKMTGFSPAVAQALYDKLAVRCEFRASSLEFLIDDLAAGHFDIAAAGLLNTPERSRKVHFTGGVYSSVALWIAKPGVEP
jgi:polar amino acid transport system substrate-binding protein